MPFVRRLWYSFLLQTMTMNNSPLPVLALNQAQNRVLSCRVQHQMWAATLAQSEDGIDQLLALLADLPGDSYWTLHEFKQTYASALSRLKLGIQQLRMSVVCDGSGCAAPIPPAMCIDARFTSPVSRNVLIDSVLVNYEQIKTHCNTYLAELVGLNVI